MTFVNYLELLQKEGHGGDLFSVGHNHSIRSAPEFVENSNKGQGSILP